MKLAKTVGPSTKVNFGAFVIQIDTLELGKNGNGQLFWKWIYFYLFYFWNLLKYWFADFFMQWNKWKISKPTLYYVIISKQKAISLVYGCYDVK